MDSPLPYIVDLDGALKGKGAPSSAAYKVALAKAEAALSELLEGPEKLELFTDPERQDDIEAASRLAKDFARDAGTIFVLGIGGSSLGGQALLEAAPPFRGPRIVFLDNPDPVTIERAIAAADLKTARFVAISKSGGTAETLAEVLVAADAIRSKGGGNSLKRHFAVVTEAKPSALRRFAEDIGCPILDHPLQIGGRYSVLTAVGVLPAILMGLDARALRKGALQVLHHAPMKASAVATGVALHAALAQEGRLRETVLWAYSDRLKTFGAWWRQLWAESLGKDGQGSTPVAALGPVDQHSQLQLFLDGPGKALFTLIDTAPAGTGPTIPAGDAKALGLGYLAGRRLGDLVDAEARATLGALVARGRPVRHIRVPRLDERAMGALFMHFMLETIVMGRLMGVDPFGQPAVEEGKVLARQYLDGMAGVPA
jgi:glucose-6-phosphate isomerase